MIGPLRAEEVDAAVALWRAAGLVRPWNDPAADAVQALADPAATVLAAREGTRPADAPSDADVIGALPDAGPVGTARDTRLIGTPLDTRLIGTVMAGFDGHRGWFYYLAVAEDRRGRGIGRALIAAGEAWLAARGAAKAQLMVRGDNDAATGFYAALGYAVQDVAVLGKRLG